MRHDQAEKLLRATNAQVRLFGSTDSNIRERAWSCLMVVPMPLCPETPSNPCAQWLSKLEKILSCQSSKTKIQQGGGPILLLRVYDQCHVSCPANVSKSDRGIGGCCPCQPLKLTRLTGDIWVGIWAEIVVPGEGTQRGGSLVAVLQAMSNCLVPR